MLYFGQKGIAVDFTAPTPYFLAVLIENESWRAFDTLFVGYVAVFVDVELIELYLALEQGLDVFYHRLHPPAVSTPGGVEFY